MKEYFDLPAETDPQRRLELTYLLLNEGMDKRNIQQQGTSHKRISDIFRIRYHRNNIKNYEKQKVDNKERRHAFLMNKNSKSKKKIKVYNKTQSKYASQKRVDMKRKTKMYKQVIKELERGNLCNLPSEPFDHLYEEAKKWSKAKLPKQMDIHTDFPQRSDREILECFTSKLTRKIPKFDPEHEQEYYLEKCAGGPFSNYKELQSKFKSTNRAAVVIQKGYRKWKANKIYKRLKYERVNSIPTSVKSTKALKKNRDGIIKLINFQMSQLSNSKPVLTDRRQHANRNSASSSSKTIIPVGET